jgi:hypothetical protein
MNERRRTNTSKSHVERRVESDKELAEGGVLMVKDDFSMFNKEGLKQIAPAFAATWEDPINSFPFIEAANLIPWVLAEEVHREFPTPKEFEYKRLGKGDNGDFLFSSMARLPESIKEAVLNFSHPLFLNFLEKCTGIKGLIPDPYLEDAGLEYSTRGSVRILTEEAKTHSLLGLHRRVGLVLSLSKGWQPDWGGNLDFVEGGELKESFQHNYNYFLLYDVQKAPEQGFKPLKCPSSYARKCIRLYFYSATRN